MVCHYTVITLNIEKIISARYLGNATIRKHKPPKLKTKKKRKQKEKR